MKRDAEKICFGNFGYDRVVCAICPKKVRCYYEWIKNRIKI